MAEISPPVASVSGANATGSGAAGAGNAGTSAVVQNPPAALARLPVDSLIQATIQSKNGAEVTLQTSAGTVTLKLPQALPATMNDLVWVRIMPQTGADGSSGLRLQVLPQTVLNTAGGAASGASAGASGAAAPVTPNPAPLIPGQSFTGVTTTSLTFPGGSTLPAGSQMQMVFISPGAASPAQAASFLPAGHIAGQTAPANIANAASTNILAGQAGQTGQAAAATNITGARPPLLLTGTVLPANSPEARMLPDGFTALRTNAGIIGVRLPVPAPVGAMLSFAVDATSAAAARIPLPVMTEGELLARGQAASLSHNWDSLQRAIAALAQADPQAAQALLNQIPAAGPRLTATMMFFFTAMTGATGSAKGWLGERTISALDGRDGKDAGLGKKLDNDFNILRNMASEPRSDGWRVMAMPFHMGERIEQMQLAWRHGHGEEDDTSNRKADDAGTRFLLDLSFTRLGHTQLDGLVRKETQKFDLIVRTENALDGPQRDDIRAIFHQALAIAKLGGALNFQNGSRFVAVSPDPASTGPQKRGFEA